MTGRNRLLTCVLVCFMWLPSGGCEDLVAENLVAGVRDGLVTFATGIVEGVIDAILGLNTDADSGNDLFIKI